MPVGAKLSKFSQNSRRTTMVNSLAMAGRSSGSPSMMLVELGRTWFMLKYRNHLAALTPPPSPLQGHLLQQPMW